MRSFYQDKNWMLDRIDQLEYDLEMLADMAPAGAVNYIRKAIGYDDYLRQYANERRLKPEDLFEVLDALQESSMPFKTYEEWFNHMDRVQRAAKGAVGPSGSRKRRRQPDDYAQLQRSGI